MQFAFSHFPTCNLISRKILQSSSVERKPLTRMAHAVLSNEVVLNDGRSMPMIGLGTYQSPSEDAFKAVQAALKVGYRHIDTAEAYKNEAAVGKAIKQSGIPREAIWVTTKFYPGEGRGYDAAIEACQNSLQRLGMDYVDLLLIHAPINVKQRTDQWRAFEELQRRGLAKSIGVSNYGIHHLEELFKIATVTPAVNQVELHPYLQRRELVTYCRSKGIAIQAYASLTRGRMLEDPPLVQVAHRCGTSTSHVLLRWALQKGFVVLPKSVKEERVRSNIDLDFVISAADMAVLDSLERDLHTCWDPVSGP
eukprot:jgi/Mesvir1/21402/Mv20881-RA.1